MANGNDVIVTRLDLQNKKQWSELEEYFKNDPYLRTKIKNRNQMMNYIISTFLLLYLNSSKKSYVYREKELLFSNEKNGLDYVVNLLEKVSRKLEFVDESSKKNNYMLLGMFNRAAVTLEDGGSIYTPGSPNSTLNQKLEEILKSDIHSNQIRQH